MADGEERNRFAYLLEPIKDLHKNWDVDLVGLLEKYLREVENDCANSSQQGCSQTGRTGNLLSSQQQRRGLNFAEAALLLQGSAQVYGKKVEYLYQLVFNFLDFLKSKRTKNNNLETDEGGDADATAGNRRRANRDDEPFESLDDIQVAGNIDLNESGSKPSKEKSPKLLTPMPLALIPLEDFEKSDVPLVVKNGEVIGRKDDYRVNTCCLHSSGALLLELSNSKLINAEESNSMVTIKPRAFSQVNVAATMVDVNELTIRGVPCQVSPEMALACPDNVSPTMPEMSVVGTDDFDPLPQPHPSFIGEGDQNVTKRNLRQRGGKSSDVSVFNEEKERLKRQKVIDEYWTELNMYEKSAKLLERPLRNGKTFRLPVSLMPKVASNRKRKFDDGGAEVVENGGNNVLVESGNFPKQTLSEFIQTVCNKRRQFPKNPLKVPVFGELDDLFWAEQNRRRLARLQKNKPKKSSAIKSIEEAEADLHLPAAEEDIDESELDRNLRAIFDGPLEADNNDDGAEFAAEPLDINDDDFHPVADAQMPIAANRENVQSEAGGTDVMQRSFDRFATYEEYVQYTVKKYLAQAQENAALSDMTKRVVEWEEKIRPYLEGEEKRRAFDIRIYGDEILDQFKLAGCTEIYFRDLAEGKEPFEICRMLLACLMLVNQRNIDVSQDGELDDAVNTMKLKFLSAIRQYVQLEELFGAAAVAN